MAWSLYQLPTRFLVEQGFFTSLDLAAAISGAGRATWERAGIDVDTHARDVAAAQAALEEASCERQLAELALLSVRRRGSAATEAAHGWRRWLAGVLDDAAAAGQPANMLVDLAGTPRLRGLTGRMQRIVADVARERAKLAPHVTRPALLDEGAVRLAAMVEAAVAEKVALAARGRTVTAEQAARAHFRAVFQRLDRDADRARALTGSAPLGAARHVLRSEARRRTAAAARDREASVPEVASAVAEPLDA